MRSCRGVTAIITLLIVIVCSNSRSFALQQGLHPAETCLSGTR